MLGGQLFSALSAWFPIQACNFRLKSTFPPALSSSGLELGRRPQQSVGQCSIRARLLARTVLVETGAKGSALNTGIIGDRAGPASRGGLVQMWPPNAF